MRVVSDQKSAWRLFERFVADLEVHLQGTSAIIKCPDKLLDIDGQEREVDCSVRCLEDGQDTLVIFECRDRKGGNDIGWIDAIESKGRDLGVTKVVAVHRRPLSTAARTKAKRVGIDVRQLERIPGRANPLGISCFGFSQWSIMLGTVKVRVSSDPQVRAKYEPGLASASLDGPIFFDSARGEPSEVRQFVSDALRETGFELNPTMPESQTVYLAVTSQHGRFFEFVLPSGRVPIEWIEFQLTIAHATEMFHHNEAARYVADSVSVDHDVDQYVHETSETILTGAGMTTERALADGRVEIQHTISLSEGIGFGPRLDSALQNLLSESQ